MRARDTAGGYGLGSTSIRQDTTRAALRTPPWTHAAHGRSEYLRLRGVVDALVRIAEHPGDTRVFLGQALATVMELTRATGAVVLMAEDGPGLRIASARGQMRRIGRDAFAGGHTLAAESLRSQQALHSDNAPVDERIVGSTRAGSGLHSLIATPLRFGEDVLGVLEVCSSVACAFDDIDTQAVALVGNALGGVLGRQFALDANARLLSRLEAALAASRAQARQYHDAALYDELTGLPNRAHFLDRLDRACAAAGGESDRFAVLFLDLDDFKAINDNHGHAAGDAVLRETAATLRSRLRGGDLIARLGGDEFVVVLDGLREGGHDVRAIAAGLESALARPRPGAPVGAEHGIHASIGWVLHDGHCNAAALLARADAAMYRHKRARRR